MEFIEPLKNVFTIYSKSGCLYCTKAKNLLIQNNFLFIEINCDDYLNKDKENFLLFMKERIGKEYRTFPMIFKDTQFIGGFTETQDYVNKNLCFDKNDDF
jgi:glutaredoxin